MNQSPPESGPSCPADCSVQQILRERLDFLKQLSAEFTLAKESLLEGGAVGFLNEDADLTEAEKIAIVKAWVEEVSEKLTANEELIVQLAQEMEQIEFECDGVVQTSVVRSSFQYIVRICTAGTAYTTAGSAPMPVFVIRENAN